jgi:hypothetical protein
MARLVLTDCDLLKGQDISVVPNTPVGQVHQSI